MSEVYTRRVYIGAVGDIKTLEEHFARMAARGWMIDKIGMYSHRYRAIEPCEKSFFVDLLPQITAFDYPDNEHSRDYRALCEDSGWTFVTANRQFHVFCADDGSAPVPIHTDNRLQAEIYLKASRKQEVFIYLYLTFVLGFLALSPLYRDGVELFLSNVMIFQMLGYLLFSFGYIWTVGFVFVWYRRVKKSARLDLPMPSVSYRWACARRGTFAFGTAAFIVCTLTGIILEILGGKSPYLLLIIVMPFAVLGAGFWARRQIATKRRERKSNIRLVIIAVAVVEVIYLGIFGLAVWQLISAERISEKLDGRPALALKDIGVESEPLNSSTRIDGSVAVPVHYSYWEINQDGNVHTEVYRTVSAALARGLYNRYANETIKSYSDRMEYGGDTAVLSPQEAAAWGADEGVAFFGGAEGTTELVLLRGRTILRLSLYGGGTDMAAGAVRSLLNG